MVKLTKIYTRGGDAGETSLGSGGRVAKHAPRIKAIGAVDEANAAIGLARLHAGAETDSLLGLVQNDLFDLGADICIPEDGGRSEGALRMSAQQVKRLETEIDTINAALAPLESFVLPGGGAAAAFLHSARTIVRRAERRLSELAAEEDINAEALRYLNRLSDLLFVMARQANDNGDTDVLWVPGANR
ncbi:MAG: cob(I)yrinic acid a,c-diamide adenosyltransferase [Rhodospirillales bacterium]|nr:cob(I)yrinic acid a,c-diamide adenosyltransferase [Rhodospirillales bacterium]